MSDCCLDNGGPGGGSPAEMSLDITTTDAVPVATGLVSLPFDGAHALLASFTLQSVNESPGFLGEGLGSWYLATGTALRNRIDGSVWIAGPRVGPAAPPAPTALWATGLPAGGGGVMLGYGPGPVFGAPLAAAALAIAANVLTLTITGLAGITLRWHLRARVWVFDGAVRLI